MEYSPIFLSGLQANPLRRSAVPATGSPWPGPSASSATTSSGSAVAPATVLDSRYPERGPGGSSKSNKPQPPDTTSSGSVNLRPTGTTTKPSFVHAESGTDGPPPSPTVRSNNTPRSVLRPRSYTASLPPRTPPPTGPLPSFPVTPGPVKQDPDLLQIPIPSTRARDNRKRASLFPSFPRMPEDPVGVRDCMN